MYTVNLTSETPITTRAATIRSYTEDGWTSINPLETALADIAEEHQDLEQITLSTARAWYRKLVALAVLRYPDAPLADLDRAVQSIAFAWMCEHAFRGAWQKKTQIGGKHQNITYVVMPGKGKDRHGFIRWMRMRGLLEDIERRLYSEGDSETR